MGEVGEKMLKQNGLNMLRFLRIHINAIYDYKNKDRLNRSENNGILFWLTEEEQELVKTFEKENPNTKVYHIIKTNSLDFGTVYDLLYVTDDEYFIKRAKADLKDGLVLSHTITQFPESGLISVKSVNGGLVRQY